MLEMLRMAISGAKRNHRHIGICGEAPANYPEIAGFLTRLGIDLISVNPSSVLRTMAVVHEAEQGSASVEGYAAAVDPRLVGRGRPQFSVAAAPVQIFSLEAGLSL